MEKLKILTKMISDISNNEKYQGAVFSAEEDCYFAFMQDKLYEIEWPDLSYMTLHFTEEEKKEVARIEAELELNYETFLPIRGGVAHGLDSLIEYYADDEAQKIAEIKKLRAVFEDENSIFYHKEQHFLDLFLYSEINYSDSPYVYSDWDHDDAYYYNLPFSTGAYDSLYDCVANPIESTVYPDYFDANYCTPEEKEEMCDRWIEILSNIDEYIVT